MRRFILRNRIYLEVALLWLCIISGVLLRTYKADLFPLDNNDDGLYYVWSGNSFLSTPLSITSHTIFDTKNDALIWRSQYRDLIPHLRFGMKIVQPWFDHPPLGTAIIAFPARLLGYDQIEQLPQLLVRLPALIASIFTLFFTFVLAKALFGKKTAYFALIFLATTPYFVFAHRQSYLENILTPIFLASVTSFLGYLKFKQKKLLLISAVLSFFCGWIKIPAFSVPLMLLAWSFYKKDYFAAKVFVLTATASVLSYLGYGFLASPSFFVTTLANQGIRGMYLSSFINSFVQPGFYGNFMDGSYILGLLFCLMILVKKNKTESEYFFAWFFVVWVLMLFFTSGQYNNSAWYKYPLLPFMGIALGVYAKELWEEMSIFSFIPFLLYGFSGYDLAYIQLSSQVLRLVTVTFFGSFFAYFCFPKNKKMYYLGKVTVALLFACILVGNILAVSRYPTQRCLREACLEPDKIILQQN